MFKLLILFVSLAGQATAATTNLPVSFGVVLFPAFQALDVFGPLDALNLLAFQYPVNLSLIAGTLDPVSTKPRSGAMNPMNSNFSESVLPTHTFATAPPLDVLIVPGGLGTRATDLNDTIDFVRETFPTLQYFVSVCTGAGIAARAGILDGKDATTNKRAWNSTVVWGPQTNWITHARWVVDGNIWTTSGVSAGLDGMLAFIDAIYGADVALNIANGMEYVRVTNSSDDPFADLYGL
ncbi:class I glutamine amidotransferase-like protein [Mycena alexandri]|uniref:Class I glutamine amidotransferase-like protein n=1 Tax=Mycena alexandri TaxID=1745969 RepID=A0AAD6WSG4_9AGAR|nr:class I glutamine amidotransferase-like protein [Mycena alexandri]